MNARSPMNILSVVYGAGRVIANISISLKLSDQNVYGGIMPADENKAFVRRYITEILNRRDLNALLGCFTEDSIDHSAPPGVPAGLAGIEQWFRMFFNGFPDAQAEIHDMIGEGDLVWHRGMFRATHSGDFLGTAPTGRTISVPVMEMNRIANNKIAEHWGGIDMYMFMQQIGIIPSPGG